MNEPVRRVPFYLRFYPSITSPDGILLDYLKEQLPPVKAEMILKALRAYWLAEAYQSSGKKRGQELKRLAQQMIFTLEEQANHLRVVFDLPIEQRHLTLLQTSTQTLAGVMPPDAASIKSTEVREEDTWDSIPVIDMDGL